MDTRKLTKGMLIACLLQSLIITGCYRMRVSKGGGQIKPVSERKLNAQDVLVPEGYSVSIAASGLNFPSAICFDAEGTPYVLEAGYSYGEVWTEPKLLKISDGKTHLIATGSSNGPWTDVECHEGNFYVAEGGQAEGGKILKINSQGTISALVEKLPGLGDHHTNGIAIRDGFIYFGQGTATNSGVVGPDNKDFGWLTRRPDFHDIPCGDVVLAGTNYESDNVLDTNRKSIALTGAYSAYNSSTSAGQVIKGRIPCTGAIMKIPLTGGAVELVAWGLRNPFGVAFDRNGKLFVTENAYDVRGSRPVWGAGDVLWEVVAGTWYGWPDYSAGIPINDNKEFKAPGESLVKKILREDPNAPPKPAAILGVHSSSNGLDFSHNAAFGYVGEAFIAQFGDMAPDVGKVLSPVGFKVIRVNTSNGVIEQFAVNKGKKNGPATRNKNGGLERPVTVKFNDSGTALYVVDFGIMYMTNQGAQPVQNTGVIWKIEKK